MFYSAAYLLLYLTALLVVGLVWFIFRRVRWLGPIVLVVFVVLLFNLVHQFFRTAPYRCDSCIEEIAGTYVLSNTNSGKVGSPIGATIILNNDGSYRLLRNEVLDISTTGTWSYDRLPELDLGSITDSSDYTINFFIASPDTLKMQAPRLRDPDGSIEGWRFVRE